MSGKDDTSFTKIESPTRTDGSEPRPDLEKPHGEREGVGGGAVVISVSTLILKATTATTL